MRNSLVLTAAVLSLAWAAPATAQMCGGGQPLGSTVGAAAGGMCGMPSRPVADDPMAAPGTPAQKQASSGCACCRTMAMMQGPAHTMPETPRPQ